MINSIISAFGYPFFLRALLVGGLVSVCAALLGVSLVLKRYSMIGDGLSHVGFGASAIAVAVGVAPLFVAVPVVVIAAFLLLRIKKSSRIKGDAAIALVSSSALAIGYAVAKLSRGGNIDISNYMFGSIYTLDFTDTAVSVILAAAVIFIYSVYYNKLFSVTFDEDFAAATGVKTEFLNTLLACLTAVTVVVGMRMMGALLISALILFPVLSATRVSRSYASTVKISVITAICSFVIGLVISVILQISPGSGVVIANLAVFCIFFAVGKIFNK